MSAGAGARELPGEISTLLEQFMDAICSVAIVRKALQHDDTRVEERKVLERATEVLYTVHEEFEGLFQETQGAEVPRMPGAEVLQ